MVRDPVRGGGGVVGKPTSGQEADADLLLLDGSLGALLDVGPYLRDVAGVLVRGDSHRLHEELVAAAGIRWWVLFHGLQQHLDLDISASFDTAGVGSNAVSVRSNVSTGRDGL